MKATSIFLVLPALLPCRAVAADSALDLRFVSPLHKLVRDPSASDEHPGHWRLPPVCDTARLVAGRNEYESIQLVLLNRSANPLTALRVECSTPGLRSELFWEHHVLVSLPSGNADLAPRWYPDALLPLTAVPTHSLGSGERLAAWLTVYVPTQASPGTRNCRVEVFNGGADQPLATASFTVQVEDYEIPVHRSFSATGALYYELVLEHYNKYQRAGLPPYKEGDAEWQRLKKALYEALLPYRLTAYDLPVPLTSPAARRYLTDPRVRCVRLPWLKPPERDESTDDYQALLAPLLATGRMDDAYYYQADEPGVPNFPDVIRLAMRLRERSPRIRHLVTIGPVLPLMGYVDLWCPSVGSRLTAGITDFRRLQLRRRLGEETWWYTMSIPRYPYPTWLIDEDAISPRVFLWMSSLFGFTGCVYSMVHGWSEDPYTKVHSFLDSNGDGLLLYPGAPYGSLKPFPSIRLMLLRDGLEDYELLQQLPQAQRLAACRALVQDETRWSRSPNRLVETRQRVVDVLTGRAERISSAPYKQAPWPGPARTVVAPPTEVTPLVDGRLETEEWEAAARCQDFIHSNGLHRAAPQTQALIQRDAAHLYVAARCALPEGGAEDPLKQQWFALTIDPGRRRTRYFFFVVTAKGNSHTELRSREGTDPTWAVPWQHAAAATDHEFTVELAIPFESLGHVPAAGETWGVNFLRRSRHQFSSWQADYGQVTLMPGLRFSDK